MILVNVISFLVNVTSWDELHETRHGKMDLWRKSTDLNRIKEKVCYLFWLKRKPPKLILCSRRICEQFCSSLQQDIIDPKIHKYYLR